MKHLAEFPSLGRGIIVKNNYSIPVEEKGKLSAVVGLIEDPCFDILTRNGKTTFFAIKPNISNEQYPKINCVKDVDGEALLFKKIEERFDVLFKISLCPTAIDFENFYPRDFVNKLKSIPESKDSSITAWEYYSKYLTSGPMTFGVIYDRYGHAINKYRDFIGATDPKVALPGTLRNTLADLKAFNLVHGSSPDDGNKGIENVRKETKWLSGIVSRILQ